MTATRALTAAIVLLFSGVAGALAADNALSPQEKAEGWILLFDGKTLDGWEASDNSQWKVENGAITASGETAGNLMLSAQRFENFVLRIDFRTPDAHANSGVFIRVPPGRNAPGRNGYEVQIFEASATGYHTGSIVHVGKAPAPLPIVANQWNTFEITADGDHYIVVLNGKRVLDVRDVNDAPYTSGTVGLQYVTVPFEFRNIKIKPVRR
jgi:hypothetical protein